MPMFHFKFPIGDVMPSLGGPVDVEGRIRKIAREAKCTIDIDRVRGTDRVISIRCEEGTSEMMVKLALSDFPARCFGNEA